jgi:hypothetical protein
LASAGGGGGGGSKSDLLPNGTAGGDACLNTVFTSLAQQASGANAAKAGAAGVSNKTRYIATPGTGPPNTSNTGNGGDNIILGDGDPNEELQSIRPSTAGGGGGYGPASGRGGRVIQGDIMVVYPNVARGMNGGAPGGGGGGTTNLPPDDDISQTLWNTVPGGGGGGGYVGGDGGSSTFVAPAVGGAGGWCQGSAEGLHRGSGPTSLPPQVVITYTWQEIVPP